MSKFTDELKKVGYYKHSLIMDTVTNLLTPEKDDIEAMILALRDMGLKKVTTKNLVIYPRAYKVMLAFRAGKGVDYMEVAPSFDASVFDNEPYHYEQSASRWIGLISLEDDKQQILKMYKDYKKEEASQFKDSTSYRAASEQDAQKMYDEANEHLSDVDAPVDDSEQGYLSKQLAKELADALSAIKDDVAESSKKINREELKKQVDNLVNSEPIRNLPKQLSSFVDKITKSAQETADKVSQSIPQEYKDTIAQVAGEIRDSYEDLADKASDAIDRARTQLEKQPAEQATYDDFCWLSEDAQEDRHTYVIIEAPDKVHYVVEILPAFDDKADYILTGWRALDDVEGARRGLYFIIEGGINTKTLMKSIGLAQYFTDGEIGKIIDASDLTASQMDKLQRILGDEEQENGGWVKINID